MFLLVLYNFINISGNPGNQLNKQCILEDNEHSKLLVRKGWLYRDKCEVFYIRILPTYILVGFNSKIINQRPSGFVKNV